MEFKDRQGKNLNRKKLKIISQSPTEMIVDMERFDDVTEEGTQINAKVFNDFQNEINSSNTKADSAVSTATTSNITANTANQKSDLAVTKADKAVSDSAQAVVTSNNANTTSNQALTTAQSALTKSESAVSSAATAVNTANTANSTADTANSNSQNAVITATTAKQNSETAVTTANRADSNASTALANSEKAIEDSTFAKEKSIAVEKALADRGATVLFGEVPQSTVTFDSNPQTQINDKLNKTFENYPAKSLLTNNDSFVIQDAQTKENKNVTMAAITSSIINATYPIGAIYLSVNSVNPSDIFGGIWEAWGAGRVPIGIGNNGETNYTTAEMTGGSENSVAIHNHTQNEHNHSQNEHNHSQNSHRHKFNRGNQNEWSGNVVDGANANTRYLGWVEQGNGGGDNWQYTTAKGYAAADYETATNNGTTATNLPTTATNNESGIAGGNRQPFITCYMWKRIG